MPMIQSDSVLRVESINLLIKHLGAVNAERFINSIKNDHFDYTRWQRDLWRDQSIEEIHNNAARFYHARHSNDEQCD